MPSNILQVEPIQDIGGWGFRLSDLMYQLKGFQGSIIEVPLNSYGGEVFEGIAIYNALKGRREKVRVKIIGYAMSMGTIVAMAGDEVIMPENGFFMVHNPWTIAIGDYQELGEESQFLEMLAQQMALIYANRTGLPLEKIRQMMDAETWLTAQEALELGFVDKLTTGMRFEASFSPREREALTKIPQSLLIKNNPAMSKKNILAAVTEAIEKVFGPGEDQKTEGSASAEEQTQVNEEEPTGATQEDPPQEEPTGASDQTEEAETEEEEEAPQEADPSEDLSEEVADLRQTVEELSASLQKIAGFIEKLPQMIEERSGSDDLADRLGAVEEAIAQGKKISKNRKNTEAPGATLTAAEKAFTGRIKRPRFPEE